MDGFSLLSVQKAIQNLDTRKLITQFYKALSIPHYKCTAHFRSLGEADFGETILDDEWDSVWSSSSGRLFTNKTR